MNFAPYLHVSILTNQNPSFYSVVESPETPVKIDQPHLSLDTITRSEFPHVGNFLPSKIIDKMNINNDFTTLCIIIYLWFDMYKHTHRK